MAVLLLLLYLSNLRRRFAYLAIAEMRGAAGGRQPAESPLVHCIILQGASLRGWLPPPATLAHKEKLNKMRMDEAVQTGDLQTPRAPWSTKQLGRRCMDE